MTIDTKKIVRVDGLARAITASLNATIGKAGNAGLGWTFGNGAPAGSKPVGSLYYDVESGDVYACMQDSNRRFWQKTGSIKGPKGDIGPAGPQGIQGPKGEKGEAGTVTPASAIADLTSAPTAGDFNALLNALRAAGLMDRPTTTPKVPVKSISISPSSPTVKANGTLRLSATVKPDNATDKTISWSSGDKLTATVTSDGTVTGIKQGTTSITATANDGSKVSSTVTLTVTSVPAQTETVDVFIGDSTTSIWDTAPVDKNWTTLIANADGVGTVNVAASGAGFQALSDKKQAFSDQVTTAIGKTRGKTVRRVFLVGLANDKDHIQSDLDAQMTAMTKTATMIKSAWPGAQLIYIVEVAPQTEWSNDLVRSFGSVINQVYTLFESNGFEVARDWFDWLPDGEKNGYLYDSMHANAKGMNVAAHKIREWVNTLSGPKINGEIPAWSE